MSALDHGPWDVMVIGAGLGGGTLGRALAEAGQRVLFVEQGRAGLRAEENGLSEIFVPEARLARGLWPEPLHVTLDGVRQAFYAPLGAGVGGSSAFYAATLERPERHDLDDGEARPHPTGGWPVGFDAMAPWYARAAERFRLSGSADPLSREAALPLRPPPEPSALEARLMARLRRAGLHPYAAPSALERLPGCRQCLGHKCPRPCKMDGRSAGVEPALATGRAALLDGAEVLRLVAEGSKISHAEIRRDGALHQLRAKRYVLCGGALGSARLLLASASEDWPEGLANRSGLVGRNLMFHLNEIFALWPGGGAGAEGAAQGTTKSLAFRDFYHHAGQRLGAVQAMGIRASYGEIAFYLNRMLAQQGLARLQPLARLPAALAHRLLGSAQLFVGLMEDLPYAQNRVTHDPAHPGRLSVTYGLSDELKARRRLFRRALRQGLRGQRHFFLSVTPELNWGHPCGTLRFGTDPAQSVLRPDCRSHDVTNLWVADASFMPTSMGVNPGLTVAANALRVADAMQGPGA